MPIPAFLMGDGCKPPLPLRVIQSKELSKGPVHVLSEIGYLLIDPR